MTPRDQLIEVIEQTMRLHQWSPDIPRYIADALLERWCPDHFEPHHYKDPDGERNHFVCHCGRTREVDLPHKEGHTRACAVNFGNNACDCTRELEVKDE